MFPELNLVNPPQVAWVFSAAFLIVLATLFICTPIIRWSREKRYDVSESVQPHRPTDRAAIAQAFGIPEILPAAPSIATSLEALYRTVRRVHEDAKRLQRIYHDRVARCVVCLAIAITALGLSLTIFKDNKDFKLFASTVDVIALTITFHQWWSALAANHRWVAMRTRAELLRQWTFLTPMFAPTALSDLQSQEDSLFRAKDKEIEDQVVQAKLRVWWRRLLRLLLRRAASGGSNIEQRIATYWSNYRNQLNRLDDGRSILSVDLAFYLDRRPIRQLAWFRLAQARLLAQSLGRERWLVILYSGSVILALLKAGFALKDYFYVPIPSFLTAEALSMALLLMTILSAAATALYVSRNDRSLGHRYSSQERRIEGWLTHFLSRDLLTPSTVAITHEVRNELLAFEDLMVEELIDWVHISSHDTVELTA